MCPLNTGPKKKAAPRAKAPTQDQADEEPTCKPAAINLNDDTTEQMAKEMDVYDSLAFTEDADSKALSDDFFSADEGYGSDST